MSKSPKRTFITGTIVAAVIAATGLLFLNPPQCPADYTQAQVDASNCIVGANIGLSLVLLLAAGIWVASAVIAIGDQENNTQDKQGGSA